MQVVGNELVVTLEILIGDVEKNSSVDAFGALLKDFHRDFVTPEQWGQEWSDERLFQNGGEGLGGEKRNQVRNELIRGGLDDHGQLHGRGLHLNCRPGVGIESAVNNVGPVAGIGHGGGVKSKTLLPDHCDKAGAGFEIGIVKFTIALVALEVSGVGRGEKRALVMVEPPCDLGRTGVLEVDDGIFVAVEMGFVKERSGTMQQAREDELGVFANALAIKAGEERSGAGSVETLVVVKDSDFQSMSPVVQEFPLPAGLHPEHFGGRGKS